MARYLLLSFSDNQEADEFLAAVANNHDVGDEKLHHVFYGIPKDPADVKAGLTMHGLPTNVYVRGMWQQPTKYCECTTRERADGFARSKKYSWWVHVRCAMPTRQWAQAVGERLFLALGKNLLPVSKEAPEWRGEGVRGHTWDKEQKAWINVETGEAKL